jgi:hypothetical protein
MVDPLKIPSCSECIQSTLETYKSTTWEAETKESQVWGQSGLHNEILSQKRYKQSTVDWSQYVDRLQTIISLKIVIFLQSLKWRDIAIKIMGSII